MNIHHLELFYYVALHGGVSAAARRIPYGIQQPAISAQIIQLEDNLGTPLFTRRPFRLTAAGDELFKFITPFFSGLDEMGRRLRGGASVNLRIGAVETVQLAYLPRVLRELRCSFPDLRFTLVPLRLDDIEAQLLAQEIDLGVAWLLGKRPAGVRELELLRVGLALMVPKRCPLKSAEELWKRDRIAQPLIAGRGAGALCQLFQRELQRRKVEWFVSIELGSQELIARYVAEGFGYGLVLADPGSAPPVGTRLLPLDGFPAVPYGLVWMGTPSPLLNAFFAEARKLAGSLMS